MTSTRSPQAPDVDRLPTAARFVYVLAVITALAAVIVAITLFSHSVPSDCYNSDPYSLTGDGQIECDGTAHPWVGAGFAVLISGGVQTFLLALVARLATVVSTLRAVAHYHEE